MFFMFTPKIGEDFQFDEYFSNGLKPPISKLQGCKCSSGQNAHSGWLQKQPVNWPMTFQKNTPEKWCVGKTSSYWEGNFSIFGRVGKKECLSLRFNSMVQNGWVSFPPTKKWLKRGIWKVRWEGQIFWLGDSPMVGFSVHLPAEWWGCFSKGILLQPKYGCFPKIGVPQNGWW